MSSVEYTSVVTRERIPSPSKQGFNPSYVAQAEERIGIAEQEESYVEELCDLIQHYRREYVRLTSEIRRSRTRFNATAYISRLPEEILAAIFEVCVANHWERYYPLKHPAVKSTAYQVTPYQWISSVLHVCGQWRRVALSTSKLWTYIAYDKLYEDWRLDFLLEHAGNLPLTLRKDGRLIEDPSRPKDVEPEFLCDWTPSGPRFCERVLQESFTRIETLALTTFDEVRSLVDFEGKNEGGGDQKGEGVSHDGKPTLNAPLMRHLLLDLFVHERSSSLFRGVSMPCLESLVLNDTPLELVQRLSCPSLTRLDIVFTQSVIPRKLLDLLESLPSLRELEVEPIGSYEAARGCAATLPRTVELPSLEYLWLAGRTPGVTRLLNQLIFPVDAAIRLSTGFFSPSLLSSIMPTVLGHVASSADPLSVTEHKRYVSPHDITIWTDDTNTKMDVYFWSTSESARASWVAGDSNPAALKPPQALTPDSSWVQCDDARLHICCRTEIGTLKSQLAILDTSRLLSLTLSSVWFSDCAEGPHYGLLGRLVFPQLETLHFDDRTRVRYPRIQQFLQGLIAPMETASPIPAEVDRDDSPLSIHPVESTQYSSNRLPLPRLKTLKFPEITFRTGDLGQPDSADGDGLLALLRRCAQRGYKLRQLEFERAIFILDEMTRTAFKDAVSRTGIADVVEVVCPYE